MITGAVDLALDSATTSFLTLAAITTLALPLLARIRGRVAAMPPPLILEAPSSPTKPTQPARRR